MWLNILQLYRTVSQSIQFSSSLSTMSKKYIFHLINAIRSRPDDNPQNMKSLNKYLLRPQKEKQSWILEPTQVVNIWINPECCLTSLNLIVAHPPVRWRGDKDLLSKFIGISNYFKIWIVSPFMCSTKFSTYWTMIAFTKCIQLRRIL